MLVRGFDAVLDGEPLGDFDAVSSRLAVELRRRWLGERG
jgi:hypothetical protein